VSGGGGRLLRPPAHQPKPSESGARQQSTKPGFSPVRAGERQASAEEFQAPPRTNFESITDEQARALNDRIFENHRDQKWLYQVVTERANIELMLVDPYWARLRFDTYIELLLTPRCRGSR